MTLFDLMPGESAVIRETGGEGAHRQHFLDMGVIPGARVTLMKYAPMGDPMELRIHGYELTLRLADAEKITVEKLPEEEAREQREEKSREYRFLKNEHPGLGEEGRFHDKSTENPVPDGETLTFALVGNQNCGKTTLFNQLTGPNHPVGNFPGVTVDRKDGQIIKHPGTMVTDLPGIYSLSPYTEEEIVSREFILREKPKGIINILDATSIERGLYLTLQLITLNIPMVLALNMMDEVRGNGGVIDINKMEKLLGIPVIPISAAKNEGVDELIKHAVHVAKYQERPGRQDICAADHRGGAVHRCIHAVMHMVEDHAETAGIPTRFAATKLIEGDAAITEALRLSGNEKETIEHMVLTMEEESGLDRSAAIADMRYSFIMNVTGQTVIKPRESREHIRSEKIDRIVTGKYTAIPSFIAVMGLVFWLTFDVIGAFLQDVLAGWIHSLTVLADGALTAAGVSAPLHSLVINGIFEGVGSVLSFVPVIVTLFFFLSMLEDSGYLARVAFVMDKLLRKIGLSGRSIVPMLIGFGCTVPAVMSSRTLPSERDRKMTVILTPFMSCSAKLPIYGFFTRVFFPDHAGLVMIGLYLFGIVTGILVALLSKSTIFKGEAVPFVMELPNYRMPGAKNVAMLLWDKAKDFIERAFSVILIATVIIWFLQNFDFRLSMTADAERSILAIIAGKAAPVFAPMGFADWRIVTALVAGFMAKESVVSSLLVLFGSEAALLSVLTPGAAASLLVFCLLYTPCIAAIASVKRELGLRWALGLMTFQCIVAWIMSFVVSIII